MKRPVLLMIATALLLAGVLAACGSDDPAASTTFDVVTSFYPIEFIARRVGGDAVKVANLTPPGGEPHDLELKPSDVRTIRDAGLIFYFDKGFQPGLEDAIQQISDKTKAVDLLAGLSLKQPPPGEEEEGLAIDPHVWLDPTLVQSMVDAVTGELSSALPDTAPDFRLRATALKRELAALDAEFNAKLANCARDEIFTSHAAFAYLAGRYGITQVAIEGLTPEAEPSSKRLQEIARQAREAQATTIFFETLVSPRVSQAVARIVTARTAILDPLEGLTLENAAKGADYFSIMRQNLAALREALGCTG